MATSCATRSSGTLLPGAISSLSCAIMRSRRMKGCRTASARASPVKRSISPICLRITDFELRAFVGAGACQKIVGAREALEHGGVARHPRFVVEGGVIFLHDDALEREDTIDARGLEPGLIGDALGEPHGLGERRPDRRENRARRHRSRR